MLALALLVTCVGADHPNDAVAPNDLAVPAHLFDRCPDFHEYSPKTRRRLAINGAGRYGRNYEDWPSA
jgi:hypothetical protein